MKVEQLDRQVVVKETGCREYRNLTENTSDSSGVDMLMRLSGYVALAVATEQGMYTREVETGLGGDRTANMVAFAVEALKLLKDVMRGEAKL